MTKQTRSQSGSPSGSPNGSRRVFLRQGGRAGMMGALASMGLLNATPARAAVTDYKALVCIYLYGGNDGNNMVVPLDATRYPRYQQIRSAAGLALSHGANTLLAGRSSSTRAVDHPAQQDFAFHYGMPEIDALYGQGQVAVVLNAGSLRRPMSKADYMAGAHLPPQLFSHSDQILQQQAGTPSAGGTGWGGRLVDALETHGALDAISVGGGGLFIEGAATHGNQLPANGQVNLLGMNFWPQAEADRRRAALRAILNAEQPNVLDQAANAALLRGMDLVTNLASANAAAPLATVFPGTQLGVQLRTVTHLIRMRAAQGPGRRVFFVALSGFDTHGGQSWQQFDLLRQLSQSVAAFQQGLAEVGAAQQVTTFTQSDFGRTLLPASGGTDHGWGNHQLVIGAAVNGGLYGEFPDFVLGGAQDATGRGVWIPRFSNQQFGASFGRWFGVDQDTLASRVFPNELSAFGLQDLGFMI